MKTWTETGREGGREEEGEKEGRQRGAQTMLFALFFGWATASSMSQTACGLKKWVMVSSNAYQLNTSLIYFFHPLSRTLYNGRQIVKDNCKHDFELNTFLYMSLKRYFSFSLHASINSVICSEHIENLLNLKSSWIFSKQITKNVIKCVFLTN